MKLDIEPMAALCDQKIRFQISELPPNRKVKVSAAMRLPWANSVLYESEAWFTADASGQVDVSKQKPDSGSYNYADSMGLIMSLQSKDPHALEKSVKNMSVDHSQFINIKAEAGDDASSVQLERFFMAKDLKRQRITDPFVGDLFYAENPGRKTVVLLGGSGSGLAVNQPFASVMASHGFNVLSLPYFGEKGLPSGLSGIPLEYVEKAFAWLRENPITQSKEIYLLAMSKGAELALVLASRYSFISRVAAIAPHAYCFQGIAFTNESSWTYQGKSLPYIRLKTHWIIPDLLRCFIRNEPFGFAAVYKMALDKATNKDAARIPVENAHADILMLVGKQNNMWNSLDGCREILDALQKHRYPHSYDLIVYEDAGESFYAPYVFPVGNAKARMAPRLWLFMGGTPEGNARAQADAWEKMVEFLQRPT